MHRFHFHKAASLLLTVCIVISMTAVFTVDSAAAPALPAANTETRHAADCTQLSGDALAYYTGSYTYENLMALSGASNVSTSAAAKQNNALYTALQKLMTDTHTFQTSYSGTGAGSLAYYWQRTDAQAGQGGSFVLVYCDKVVSINSTSSFNREHVWPKSNASFNQSNGGSDLHHLRPADPQINSTRGNKAFGNVRANGGSYTTGSCYWTNSTYFEPKDNIKGDVARILLYVYVRWGENNIYSDTSNGDRIIESLDTLLEWIALDPVDTWEMKRNDLIEDVQGNRNVFIDYPELAWKMFGRSIPDGLTTPSSSTACKHNWQVDSETAPTCTKSGAIYYSCTLCGDQKTETVPALGHDYTVESEVPATCLDGGSVTYICSRCGAHNTEETVPLGHTDGNGDGFCDRCGEEMPVVTDFTQTTALLGGMHLMIYHPASNQFITSTASGNKLEGVEAGEESGEIHAPEDAAVFVVEETDGAFLLRCGGQYLTSGQTGNALFMQDAPDDYSLWTVSADEQDDFVYLNSVNAHYRTGDTQSLEYYGGAFTTYGLKENSAYQYELYAVPGHIWDEGVITHEPTQTEAGVKTCTCTLCGETKEVSIPALSAYLKGDVDLDGSVTIVDVSVLLNALSGGADIDLHTMDLNENNVVGIPDVTCLLNILAANAGQ